MSIIQTTTTDSNSTRLCSDVAGEPDMRVVHLTASRSLGGKERQIIELGAAMPPRYRTIVVAFHEDGGCERLLEAASAQGMVGVGLRQDFPRVRATLNELTQVLRDLRADVVCCHGYKAKLLGWRAARQVGIPVVGVSHGWTGESTKVRLYEALSRRLMRYLDHVVCVSASQAQRVSDWAGVPAANVSVICDAVRASRFDSPDPSYRGVLERMFLTPPPVIVGAAGRLSPEKGNGVLVEAAQEICRVRPDVGIVLFGDGPLESQLAQRIEALGLSDRFMLAGHRNDLDHFLPHLDLFVLPSFTEGLPNVVLESFAAGVAVVATEVGGTPELIEHGNNGYLVPAGDPHRLAQRVLEALRCERTCRSMGEQGRLRVEGEFTFEQQSRQYAELFERLVRPRMASAAVSR